MSAAAMPGASSRSQRTSVPWRKECQTRDVRTDTLPAARTRPCAGKYIDIYVGFMVIWKLSKCCHITGVGLVNLPEAKVSPASRKLKSSWINGRGMGQRGRMAIRSSRAERPTVMTAKRFLRARRPNACSRRTKKGGPSLGKQNAIATAIAVRAPSTIISEAPRS